MKSVNRRSFLKKSAVTAAGIMVSSPVIKKGFAKNSPNETVNVAVIGIGGAGRPQTRGIGGRGSSHYKSLAPLPNVNVAAICDID